LALTQGDYSQARALATQALAEASASADVLQQSVAHNVLGSTATRLGEYVVARRHFEEFLACGETLGSEYVITAKLNLGVVALDSGETEAAVPLFEEVLAYHRREGIAGGVAWPALNLGQALYRLGEAEQARAHFEEARAAFENDGFRAHVAHALQGLAAVEARFGEAPDEAARLLGQAASTLADVGATGDDFDPWLVSDAETNARSRLGDEGYEQAYAAGLAERADLLDRPRSHAQPG
jgi:tetratricopeptide (TPR) repeat protein